MRWRGFPVQFIKFTQIKITLRDTMNYPKNPGFKLNQSRHCAYITYNLKNCFLKILSVYKLPPASHILQPSIILGSFVWSSYECFVFISQGRFRKRIPLKKGETPPQKKIKKIWNRRNYQTHVLVKEIFFFSLIFFLVFLFKFTLFSNIFSVCLTCECLTCMTCRIDW